MGAKKRATGERFTTARKGYDPGEVEIYVNTTEHRLDELGAALASARARVRSLEAEVQTYADREAQFTGPVHEARQRADAIVAAAERLVEQRRAVAEADAAAILAAGRSELAREAAELDSFRMAIAAEAATLSEVEQRLAGRISRAAAALVEIVDAPGGLGPFSHATGSLVEFGQLLLKAHQTGALGEVRIELEEDVAAATIVAGGTRPPTPPPTGTEAAAPEATPADGAAPRPAEGPPQAKAANSSSMAFN